MTVITAENNKKHKLLIISPTPPPFSGPEVMTAHLLNSPLKNKYELIHYNISKGRDVSTKARFDLINILYGLFQPLQLFTIMLKHRPDLVYTNWAQTLAGFLRYASFIFLVAIFRTPIVVRVMGDGFNHFYGQANLILRALIRITVRRVERFIVRSVSLKQQFSGVVPDNRLRVVFTGIDVKEFEEIQVPQTCSSKENRIRILFVGYLTKAKGALDLLQAVPLVVAEAPQVLFQLMGSKVDVERNITYVANPESNEAILQELLSRKDISEHIELLGVQSGQEKINTFLQADIFVMPSYSETTPVVALEAMAAGLPVVATPVGLLPYAFNENNILFFEPGNIAHMAENILEFVRDPDLRRRMGERNRKIVQKEFDLVSYANRLDNLFRELLHQ